MCAVKMHQDQDQDQAKCILYKLSIFVYEACGIYDRLLAVSYWLFNDYMYFKAYCLKPKYMYLDFRFF